MLASFLKKRLIQKVENYARKNNISISYVGDYESAVNYETEMSKLAMVNFQIYDVEDLKLLTQQVLKRKAKNKKARPNRDELKIPVVPP